MKRRVRKIANFFAFNLLFFALYLNFIHNDNTGIPGENQTASQQTEAFSGTVLVDNEPITNQTNAVTITSQPAVIKKQENNTALKLSIN